jgi:hypothetical protein
MALEKRKRGHTYTLDNGGTDGLVEEEMRKSKSVRKPVGMFERECGM